MSWAEEDWTVGLSGRVLQKVKELQVHQERLSRENKQKELQLDNINDSLQKQNVKYEEVREEFHAVQRELQCVLNEAKAEVTSRERLTQDLHTKQAQICSFEGQLDAAHTTNNKLTQEIKRLEAELEKIQNSNRSADTSLFSTPCWNPTSPWEHNGSRKEERHRDEGQNQASHIRQRLQFPEGSTSLLPQQQHKNTTNFHPSNQSDVFAPLAAFPWERDDSRPAARRFSTLSPQTPCADVFSPGQSEQSLCGKEKDRRTEADILLPEMRSRVSALEEELCAKAGALKLIQNDMLQSKKELASRDVNIQRTRNELSLAHTRISQESERASGAEQRLKQLQEELKCQRQNAESSLLHHQQRTKELEKEHQRDSSELQKERQCLQKQHQQEVNKLNQELQQARTLHNALQAQADKLSVQKQALDKELDTLKEKLKWTEGQLQESQKKEAQTQAKLKEAVREAEGVAVSVEQSRKRERALEEEGRRLAEELADALRLLKELQEQKAAPAPPQQIVQFSPVGQSSFPQHSYSPHSRPSTHINRPSTATSAEQTGEEEDVFKRRAEITSSYPSRDREPGEGIDSEHISPDSESSHRRKSNEEDNYVVIESDSSGPNKHSTFDHVLCSSSQSAATNPSRNSMDGDHFAEKAPSLKSEQSVASGELKRENARLLSELHDAREELQKRLEDLEAQRRAETEARTRLKQLSRKHASQAAGKEEQDKGWKAQLETERAEKEGLKNAMAALEMEMKRGREQREKKGREEQEEEKTRAQEDRESEMIELNIQLKKHLAEVKAQLALEREERKREEEQKNQKSKTDMDLSMKLEQLQAELEEIKCIRKKDSLEEEKISLAYSPLTYLILHDDKLNSNTVPCDKKLLPSPEQHLLFCQSTNQRNMFVSQATAGLIQEDGTLSDTECSPLSDERQRSRVASHLEETRQNYLAGCSPSDQREALCNLQKGEPVPSHLAREMERLQKETATETERANHSQVKLEALQSQVTRQTQQLTMAFEKQSQHISGLLAELQEKERELLSQGKELKRYKQELNALKAQKEGEEMTVKQEEDGEQKEGTRDERSVEISALQQHQEKESAVTFLTMNSLAEGDSSAHSDAGHGVKRPTPIRGESDSEDLCSGDWDKSLQSDHDSACVMGDAGCGQDGGSADIVAELLALRQENRLLKQRIEGLSVPDTRNPSLHTDKKSQNTGDATLTCLAEQKSPSVPNDIPAEARQSPPQNEKGRENEVGDLEREEELEKELQIHHLHQQVVELHTQLQAFSEQTKQQSEELAVWRLASQPAPAFDQFPPNADNQCETQHHISAVRQPQSNQQQTYEVTQVQAPTLGVQESTSNVTIIREDELFLSSSSNKLQGRMLFSSLQHSNLPEPKCLHSSKKTLTLEEYNQDTAKIDEEKENQENNLLRPLNTCQTQHKEKRDSEVIQISSEKRVQHVTKDSHQPSAPKQTKAAEGYTGNIEAKGDTSRATVEINTNYDSSDVRTERKSVCSQTEKSLYLHSPPKASAYTQTEEEEEEEEEELVESPPISPVLLSKGAESGDKMLFSGSFPIPADPARLAERIRRNRTQLSAAFDDTEYEPYGLPEVVMKGFADIPSGPSCPYIVRRGLLGTTVKPVPQHDPQKNSGQEEETD